MGVNTDASIEHFLIIDNDNAEPKVLFDWAASQNMSESEKYAAEMQDAGRAMLSIINPVPQWYSLCNAIHRIAQLFLPQDDPLLLIADEKATHAEPRGEAADLLTLLTIADEAVFAHLNQGAPALGSPLKHSEMALTIRGLETLNEISTEDVEALKVHLSYLSKFCVVLAMEHIRNDSDESSESGRDTSDEETDDWGTAKLLRLQSDSQDTLKEMEAPG